MEEFDEDIHLTEYQAAQDSAQHHDQLIWVVTSIVWAGALALLVFIIGELGNAEPNQKDLCVLLTILSIFGIILVSAVACIAKQFRSIVNAKYKRCQDIETASEKKMHQHLDIKDQDEKRCKLCTQWSIYKVVTMLFVVVWIVVILSIWNVCF